MESFKVVVGSEMKRIATLPASYAEMIAIINKSFKAEFLPPKYLVKYQDADGDSVIVSSEADFKIMKESSGKQLKVLITPPDASLIEILDQSIAIEPALSPAPTKTEPALIDFPQTPPITAPAETPDKAALLLELREKIREIRQQRLALRTQIEGLRLRIDQISLLEAPAENGEDLGTLQRKLQKAKSELAAVRAAFVSTQKKILALDGRKQTRVQGRRPRACEPIAEDRIPELLTKLSITPEMIEERVLATVKLLMPTIQRRVSNELVARALLMQQVAEKPIQKEVNEVVHTTVTCDGCGAFPLKGLRYKCQVCLNFDLCANCHSTKAHPHAFTEVAKERKAAPVKSTGRVRGIKADLPVQPKASISTPELISSPTTEKKPSLEVHTIDPQYSAEARQAQILPRRANTTSGNIWVTFDIKNSGAARWPKSVMLYHQSGLESKDKIEFPFETRSGESSRIVVMFENPKKAGNFVSKWRLGYVDEETKSTIYFGQDVTMEFTVTDESQKASAEPLASNEAIQQANKLQEIFPNLDFLVILKKVSSNEGKTTEELIELLMN